MLRDDKPDPLHWYFTFGMGEPRGGGYMEVTGVTYGSARRVCMALNADRWAFQYGPDEFDKSRFPKGCLIKVTVEMTGEQQ